MSQTRDIDSMIQARQSNISQSSKAILQRKLEDDLTKSLSDNSINQNDALEKHQLQTILTDLGFFKDGSKTDSILLDDLFKNLGQEGKENEEKRISVENLKQMLLVISKFKEEEMMNRSIMRQSEATVSESPSAAYLKGLDASKAAIQVDYKSLKFDQEGRLILQNADIKWI